MAFLLVGALACGGTSLEVPWRATSGDVEEAAAPPAGLAPDDPFAPAAVQIDPLAPPGAHRPPSQPSLLQRSAARVRNAYILKLAPGAPVGPRTRWARMVARVGELGATSPFQAADQATAERLDLGRWRTFRSVRPYEDVVSHLEQSSDIAWVEAVIRLAGSSEAAGRTLPAVTTIRALSDPTDPHDRTITSLVLAERLIGAVDSGATTVWVPWVGLEHSEVLAEACAYARERGVVVVAPVGDQGYDDFVAYPAALDTTLAVGAEPPDEAASPWLGNAGAGLDLVAPGADSFAASAEVAAAVGELSQSAPGSDPATPGGWPRDVYRRLVASSLDRGPIGWDPRYGHGRLDPIVAATWELAEPDQELIVAVDVERRSGNRAVLSWVTAEPASTVVEWEGGDHERAAATRTHRVVVTGRPGEVRRFAIVSESATRRGRRRVTVQF